MNYSGFESNSILAAGEFSPLTGATIVVLAIAALLARGRLPRGLGGGLGVALLGALLWYSWPDWEFPTSLSRLFGLGYVTLAIVVPGGWTGRFVLLCAAAPMAGIVLALNYAPPWFAVLGTVLAAVLLGAVLAVVLAEWGHRRRVWLTDPAALVARQALDSPPPHLVAGLAAVCAVIALSQPASLFSVLTLLLAGLAALGSFHRSGFAAAGTVGLYLIGLMVVSLGVTFGWGGRTGLLFSVSVAGGYLLWLSGFWRQQLHDGKPWTTTGRLIPTAHRLSVVACVFLPIHASESWVHSARGAEVVEGITTLVLTTLSLIGLALLQRRHAGAEMARAGSIAAICCLFAAASPLADLLERGGLTGGAWRISLAFGGLLLAVRASLEANPSGSPTIHTAFLCAIVPVVILAPLVVERNGTVGDVVAIAVSAVAVTIWLTASRRSPGRESVNPAAGSSP